MSIALLVSGIGLVKSELGATPGRSWSLVAFPVLVVRLVIWHAGVEPATAKAVASFVPMGAALQGRHFLGFEDVVVCVPRGLPHPAAHDGAAARPARRPELSRCPRPRRPADRRCCRFFFLRPADRRTRGASSRRAGVEHHLLVEVWHVGSCTSTLTGASLSCPRTSSRVPGTVSGVGGQVVEQEVAVLVVLLGDLPPVVDAHEAQRGVPCAVVAVGRLEAGLGTRCAGDGERNGDTRPDERRQKSPAYPPTGNPLLARRPTATPRPRCRPCGHARHARNVATLRRVRLTRLSHVRGDRAESVGLLERLQAPALHDQPEAAHHQLEHDLRRVHQKDVGCAGAGHDRRWGRTWSSRVDARLEHAEQARAGQG